MATTDGRAVAAVTGASAGVGRAAVREFARAGYAVALLARGQQGLDGAAEDVRACGVPALTVSVDVADADAVERSADRIERELGQIDVWVNCAFTGYLAPLSEVTIEEFHRVTDVTYHGQVHGTVAALRRFRPRDSGVVVNVGSAMAFRGIPLQSSYSGAKHAIAGFTESVVTELINDRSSVDVRMVQLPGLNTPQFRWMLNKMPRRPMPVAPIYQPELAGRAIRFAAEHPRRNMWVGISTARRVEWSGRHRGCRGCAVAAEVTPRPGGGSAGSFTHSAFFYRGDSDYLGRTLSFIRAGLAAGHHVAAVVPPVRMRLLRAGLGGEADRVPMLDMATAGRNPGWIIPGILRAFADGRTDRHVRIIGEPVWPGRTPAEYSCCVQHEALINLAFAGRDASILCPYDTRRLGSRVLADAEATHPVIVDGDGDRGSATFAPGDVLAAHNPPLPEPVAVVAWPFDRSSLRRTRRFVAGEATRLGASEDRVEDIVLVAAELTANSVAHGGGSGTIRIWPDGGQVACEVRDRGHVTDALAGRRPASVSQVGGRDLLLVHQLSDLVQMQTAADGTAVRAHVSF